MRDADIDVLSADGAQDTSRWADALTRMAETMRRLELAQHKPALVGETGEPANPVRRQALLDEPID